MEEAHQELNVLEYCHFYGEGWISLEKHSRYKYFCHSFLWVNYKYNTLSRGFWGYVRSKKVCQGENELVQTLGNIWMLQEMGKGKKDKHRYE